MYKCLTARNDSRPYKLNNIAVSLFFPNLITRCCGFIRSGVDEPAELASTGFRSKFQGVSCEQNKSRIVACHATLRLYCSLCFPQASMVGTYTYIYIPNIL